MPLIKRNKLKAAFLLTVFALNTVIAFACSLGLDLGYNKHHHDDKKKATFSNHEHLQQNNGHQVEPDYSKDSLLNLYSKKSSHHHNTNSASHPDKETPDNDDCCTDNAIKFQAEDKKLQQSQNIVLKAPVFVAFLSAFLGFKLSPVEVNAASCKYFVPQYYPPPNN